VNSIELVWTVHEAAGIKEQLLKCINDSWNFDENLEIDFEHYIHVKFDSWSIGDTLGVQIQDLTKIFEDLSKISLMSQNPFQQAVGSELRQDIATKWYLHFDEILKIAVKFWKNLSKIFQHPRIASSSFPNRSYAEILSPNDI